MSDMANAILDAAEKHIRLGGFAAFSHRNLAEEVGVKSSSVHYHFPTKDRLAAAVIERYKGRVADLLEQMFSEGSDPVKVTTDAFRLTLDAPGGQCPCVSLGAELQELPPEVTGEVKEYYQMVLAKMVKYGIPEGEATVLMSTLLGAQLLSSVFHDHKYFNTAVEKVLQDNRRAAA